MRFPYSTDSGDPDLNAKAPIPRNEASFALVLVLWAIQSSLNVMYVLFFGANLFFHDDHNIMDGLTGAEPLSLSWLWARLSEHRFPVVRLMLWTIARLTDNDFRFYFILNSLLVCLSGLVLLTAIRRARGKSILFDIVIIGFACSWIHVWNMMQAVGMTFALYQFLVACLLSMILLRFWESNRLTWLTAILLMFLVLNGGIGLITSAPLVLYVLVCGAVLWKREEQEPRRRAMVLFLTATVVVLLMGAIVIPEGLTNEIVPGPSLNAYSVVVFFRVLTMPLGIAVRDPWLSHPWATLAVAAAFLGFAGLMAATALRRKSEDRLRTLGFICVMTGTMLIAGAIGLTRLWVGELAGLWFHYATVSSAFPLALYLMTQSAPRAWINRIACPLLLLISLFALSSAYSHGWRFGTWRREGAVRIEQALAAGNSFPVIVERRREYFYAYGPWNFIRGLEQLKARGQGPFGEEPLVWLGRLPPLDFFKVSLIGYNTRNIRVRPVEEGAVEKSGDQLILKTEGKETRFTIPWFDHPGRGGFLMRIELYSPVESTARLISKPARGEGPEVLEGEVLSQKGFNALQFLVPPERSEGRQWEFIPGGENANYRLENIAILELPIKRVAPPPGLYFRAY